jgi:hypothetical protein
MFYTIDIFTRPSATVPFFGSTTAGKALKSAIPTANKTVVLGHHTATSSNVNKSSTTQIRKWVDQASYDAYMTANATAHAKFQAARDAYNAANNITVTSTGFNSVELLF